MRFLVPLFVFLAVSAFHSARSAFAESSEEEEVTQHDGLSELQKIDQMEFQKKLQMNVTEEENEETRYLEAGRNGSVEELIKAKDDNTAEGGGKSEGAAHEESESESSEEAYEHPESVTQTVSSSEEISQDSTKEQDELE